MVRLFRLLIIPMLAAALLLGGSAPRVAASVELDQLQEVVDEFFCIQPHLDSACYNGGAQTVTAGVSGELFAVELYLARQDLTTTTRDLVVEIRAGGPAGALMATSDPVPADSIPTLPAADWILVEFPTRPILTAGDVFAIVIPIEPLSATTDPAWGWGKSLNDVYAGGVAWGGSALGGWDPYVDGSDLAFATYVETDAPFCDLALALPDGELIDDQITVEVGAELEVYGFGFGPFVEVTIEIVAETGEFFDATDVTDIFGDFEGVVVFEESEIGAWEIVAYPTDDPECIDAVLVNVVAAGSGAPIATATPTPTPTPTPALTPSTGTTTIPTPTPGVQRVPDTAAPAPASVEITLVLVGMTALSLGLWVDARRRSRGHTRRG